MIPMIGQMADVVHHAHDAASNTGGPQDIFIARRLPFSHTRRSIYTPVRRMHGDSTTVFATMIKLPHDGGSNCPHILKTVGRDAGLPPYESSTGLGGLTEVAA